MARKLCARAWPGQSRSASRRPVDRPLRRKPCFDDLPSYAPWRLLARSFRTSYFCPMGDRMWRTLSAIVGWWSLASVFACSSTPNPHNVCSMTPLSQSNCPSTYPSALSQCEADNVLTDSLGDMAGHCGGALLFSASTPFGGYECSYDSTTKALVGALDQEGDVEGPGGCLGSSSGESNPSCSFTQVDCSPSDGGTSGARRADGGATDAGPG